MRRGTRRDPRSHRMKQTIASHAPVRTYAFPLTLALPLTLGALAFLLVGLYAPASFLSHFTVFVLACFVGYMVIWNVTPSLHTPLMSVTNAISSIIAIGALMQIAPHGDPLRIRRIEIGGDSLVHVRALGANGKSRQD